jgi:hypothetical protein
MTLKFGKIAFLLASIWWSPSAMASSLPPLIELHSLETVERTISGTVVDRDVIYQFIEGKEYFISTPFKADGKTREEIFGPMTASERVKIGAEGEKARPWRGAAVHGEVLMLLDGVGLEIVTYSLKNKAYFSRHSIVWDTLRPPVDRGGEATLKEREAFRAKFKSAMSKAGEMKFVGMTKVHPSKWESKSPEFWIATRAAEFPLLRMSCTEDDVARCRIIRACYTEGDKDLAADSISGVGTTADGKYVWVLDRMKRKLRRFTAGSCFHMQHDKEMDLTEKLFEPSNIHIDESDRLWITTIRQDDYYNSSLTWWPVP